MYRLLCRNGFKGMVLFFCVPWALLGCGSFDAPGSDDSGSLFNIDQIDPTYFDESTRQVDVVRVDCAAPGGGSRPGTLHRSPLRRDPVESPSEQQHRANREQDQGRVVRGLVHPSHPGVPRFGFVPRRPGRVTASASIPASLGATVRGRQFRRSSLFPSG